MPNLRSQIQKHKNGEKNEFYTHKFLTIVIFNTGTEKGFESIDKEFKYFYPKNFTKLMVCIWNPDPGSKKQRIRIRVSNIAVSSC